MITCEVMHLRWRCDERGYSWDEVQPCIVSRDGDTIVVDVDHPAYPKVARDRETGGVGTELKNLLAKVGITATPDCSCNARAKLMDERGIGWCEQNIEEIVGWLREEATKRGLPFVDMAGRMLVKRAIHNARKATLE